MTKVSQERILKWSDGKDKVGHETLKQVVVDIHLVKIMHYRFIY